MKSILEIEGMSCNHCVQAVRRELERLEGVTVADVGIGTATLHYHNAPLPADVLRNAVERAGYTLKAVR